MGKEERPDYGHIAWKHFAFIGLIGAVGLATFIIGFLLRPPWNWVLHIPGGVLAFVGLYLSASYLLLYNVIFSGSPDRDFTTWSAGKLGIRGNEIALDIGCGTGGVAIKMAKHLSNGKVTGIDIFEGISGNSPDVALNNARIEGVSDRVDIKHGDALGLPFEDESVDIVTMGSVLHEIHPEENVMRALQEVHRVLKPGGRFVTVELLQNSKLFVSLLFLGFLWKKRDYWYDHIERNNLRITHQEVIRGPIDMGFFIAEKPVVSA
jgi:ubiquinone/menaquinone biosynthesis C-methylase UbiE